MNRSIFSTGNRSNFPHVVPVVALVVLLFISVPVGSGWQVCLAQAPGTNEHGSPPEFQFIPAPESGFRLTERLVEAGVPETIEIPALMAALDLPEPNLQEPVPYWLGSFSYGDIDSRRVAVLVQDNRPSTLHIDLNRDQKFSLDEQIAAGPDGTWRFTLDAEYQNDEETPLQLPLQVQGRWDANTKSLRIATAGTMQGTVVFQGQSRLARYEDRDANGRWFDLDDRLFVDLNGDGKIDSITERMAGSGMRQLGGTLYAISGDRTGRSLAINEVRERGRLVPLLTLDSETARVTRLSASLVSQQGMRVDVSDAQLGQPIEVPIGNWQVSFLEVELTEGDQAYYFRFAAVSRGQFATSVTAEEATTMELLGELKLSAQLSFNRGEQTTLLITPSLYSQSGMYLILSRVGPKRAESENHLRSISYGGTRYLGAGTSGFL
ncbi:MAG: hypothetical protein Q8M16_07330 [Pirellulaceae bacterium]|nr:hypothetical protein [Pirellulaceae bacterium]